MHTKFEIFIFHYKNAEIIYFLTCPFVEATVVVVLVLLLFVWNNKELLCCLSSIMALSYNLKKMWKKTEAALSKYWSLYMYHWNDFLCVEWLWPKLKLDIMTGCQSLHLLFMVTICKQTSKIFRIYIWSERIVDVNVA